MLTHFFIEALSDIRIASLSWKPIYFYYGQKEVFEEKLYCQNFISQGLPTIGTDSVLSV